MSIRWSGFVAPDRGSGAPAVRRRRLAAALAAAATASFLAAAGAFAASPPHGPAEPAASAPAREPAAAQAARPASALPEPGAPGIEVSIRFFDKRVYYPESEIALKVTIANKGGEAFRFKLADDRMYSLAFDARTPTNRPLEASDVFRKALAESKPVFYREISIKSGEEYSFVERLERYVRIDGPGTFAVKASFFPELSSPPSAASIASNVLTLSVRPSAGLPPAQDLISKETGEVLKAQALPPDEVVRRTVVARQKGRWNEFFLYLDLEAVMTRNEDRKALYDRESDEGRRRMVERYRNDLMQGAADDIVVVPFFFEIAETRYASGRGFVRALEKFRSQQLVLVKEYTYEVQKRDDVWYIVGYTVLNKGTE